LKEQSALYGCAAPDYPQSLTIIPVTRAAICPEFDKKAEVC